jgi:DNA-directed RNA polymerase specialized sigma24 family protein
LQDLPTQDIEQILGLTPRQRDYLQQRFKYHLVRFTFTHRWELVHQWLEVDLEKNLGLAQNDWDKFLAKLTPQQQSLLRLKKEQCSDLEISKAIGCTANQVQKQWFKILELAWEIRNEQSGENGSSDE